MRASTPSENLVFVRSANFFFHFIITLRTWQLPKMVNIYPLALGLALVLAAHGYRKGSLNKSGSLCALIIGYITMGNPLPTFGILLIGFYLAGSKATKVKADVKATLERELSSESKEIKGEKNQSSSHKASTGGQRDALQVLCNSFTCEYVVIKSISGLHLRRQREIQPTETSFHFAMFLFSSFSHLSTAALAALIYRLLYSGEVEPSSIITILKPILKRVGNHTSGSILKSVTLSTLRDDEWCPLDSKFGSGVPKFLLLLAVGHFSCCMGDTLASEVCVRKCKSKCSQLNFRSEWKIHTTPFFLF